MSMRLFRTAVVFLTCVVCCVTAVGAQDSQPDEQAEAAVVDAAEEAMPEKKSTWKKMFGGKKGSATSETTKDTGVVSIVGAYTYSAATQAMQNKLHKTQAATIPEVRSYMFMVDTGQAGPRDLHAFALLLSQEGFLEVALVYSAEALLLEPDNAQYWTNHGTIARYAGDNKESIKANLAAIELDPGLALAHYNLGVSYDANDKYDQAIEEYVAAFTLDPTLADPRFNPQVVNNFSYAAASLVLYERRAGHQALPLIPLAEINPGELTIRDDTFN